MLTTAQQDALRAVQEAYPEARMALIGAAALALHMPMEWRTTADIDLVVAISVADLTKLSRLPGWKRDPNRQQRWVAPNGVLVDLVPASLEALERRELVWPNGHDQHDAAIVERFLERTAEGHGQARLLANSPWRFFDQNLQDRIDAFRDGFQAASSSEQSPVPQRGER